MGKYHGAKHGAWYIVRRDHKEGGELLEDGLPSFDATIVRMKEVYEQNPTYKLTGPSYAPTAEDFAKREADKAIEAHIDEIITYDFLKELKSNPLKFTGLMLDLANYHQSAYEAALKINN